jgi:hypothetical protein
VSHLYLDSCSRSSIKKNQHLGTKPAKNTVRGAAQGTPGEQLQLFNSFINIYLSNQRRIKVTSAKCEKKCK